MVFRIGAARVAAAASLATLLLIPIEAAAKSGGVGFHAHLNFPKSPHVKRYRGLNAFPYGGYFAGVAPSSYYTGPTDTIPPLQVREFPPDPPRVLTCQRSQETITVRAEGGGERQVRITRC